MHILHEDEIDISGFAAIRERVLIQDRHFFAHNVPDACWDGFAGCVYLANAWFKARGQTGLHHHTGVDIFSLIPRGSILHQGSLGDAQQVQAGQVQIQRDGNTGFSHNEINPNNDIQPMLQMWIKPAPHAATPEYQIIDIKPGLTCVYGGDLFPSATSVYTLNWPEGGEIQTENEVLLYIASGEAEISENGINGTVKRGNLIKGADMKIRTPGNLIAVMVTQHSV